MNYSKLDIHVPSAKSASINIEDWPYYCHLYKHVYVALLWVHVYPIF